jgi:hypothetical protein
VSAVRDHEWDRLQLNHHPEVVDNRLAEFSVANN